MIFLKKKAFQEDAYHLLSWFLGVGYITSLGYSTPPQPPDTLPKIPYALDTLFPGYPTLTPTPWILYSPWIPYPQKGHGTRDILPPEGTLDQGPGMDWHQRYATLPEQNDRHLWKHYLPATNVAGGKDLVWITAVLKAPIILVISKTPTLAIFVHHKHVTVMIWNETDKIFHGPHSDECSTLHCPGWIRNRSQWRTRMSSLWCRRSSLLVPLHPKWLTWFWNSPIPKIQNYIGRNLLE